MHGIIKSTKLSLFLFYSVPGKGSFSWGGKAKGERKEVFALCVLKEDWGGGDRVERGGGGGGELGGGKIKVGGRGGGGEGVGGGGGGDGNIWR